MERALPSPSLPFFFVSFFLFSRQPVDVSLNELRTKSGATNRTTTGWLGNVEAKRRRRGRSWTSEKIGRGEGLELETVIWNSISSPSIREKKSMSG